MGREGGGVLHQRKRLLNPKKIQNIVKICTKLTFLEKILEIELCRGLSCWVKLPTFFTCPVWWLPYMRYFEAQRWYNRYPKWSDKAKQMFCGDISSLKFSKQIILCCISCIRFISVMWIYLWAVFPSDNREKIVCPEVGSQFQIWK